MEESVLLHGAGSVFNHQSYLIQDEPEAGMCFQYKMSLNGGGAGMLGIDHQHATGKAHERGADPGFMAASEETVTEKQYHVQGKKNKGLLRSDVAKVTSLSRAQVTRLIGQCLATGKIEERGYLSRRFPSVYTRKDSELLATVDEAHETLSGPATQKILYREFQEFGKSEYERRARLSVAHLYNLRKTARYRKRRGYPSGDPPNGGEHRGEGTSRRSRRKQRCVSPQCRWMR
jgi:hypothetical protein